MNNNTIVFYLGKTEDEITKLKLSSTEYWYNKEDVYYLDYPECKKHPNEQIELFLHYLKNKNNIILNISTFSPVLINFVGHLIHSNKLEIDSVKIIIKLDNEIRECMFNEKGYIENYPIGFLEPNHDKYYDK